MVLSRYRSVLSLPTSLVTRFVRPSLIAILSGSGENVFYVAGLNYNDVGDRFRWRRWWVVVRRARLWLARGVDRPASRSCERGKPKSYRKDRRKEGMLPFMHPTFVPSKKLVRRGPFLVHTAHPRNRWRIGRWRPVQRQGRQRIHGVTRTRGAHPP